jgi:flagellar biosynthesis/type III secretory pathway chaperone
MLDPQLPFIKQVTTIQTQLETLEQEIIAKTEASITPEQQATGKLLQRIPEVAQVLNDASQGFFRIITEICREASLATFRELPRWSSQSK